MTALIPKKMIGINNYESLIEAIKVAESPISIDSNYGWTIYRYEWARELLTNPEEVNGFDYWIDHEQTQDVYPVNNAQDIASIIGHTIECPFLWSIETTSGEYWMETDTSDLLFATKEALSKFNDMTIVSLSLNR